MNTLRYKAYGAYAANAFDDHEATPTTSSEIVTKPPIPLNSRFPPFNHDFDDDPRPHLPSGCDFVRPNSYKYTKNGKSATGSTCEIAQINWNIKYNQPKPVPFPVPRPVPVPVIIHKPPHRVGNCVKDGHNYVYKGLVRCSDPRKHGCSREVIGDDCAEAKRNFCKLYGPGGKCLGDPSSTPQSPKSFEMDNDRTIVIKIIDDDLPDAVPVEEDEKEQKVAESTPPAAAAPTPPPAAAGGIGDIFSGTTGGISNALLIGGGVAALLLMLVVVKR